MPAVPASAPWPGSALPAARWPGSALRMRVRSIPPRAARRPRGRWQAAASAASLVSESIASWASVPESARVPALAGDSLRLCAADLDREDLGVGRAPVAGARTAQQRHRARLGERVRELE